MSYAPLLSSTDRSRLKQFEEGARLLWGARFGRDASRELGVDYSSIVRWRNRQRAVPTYAIVTICRLLRERRQEIDNFLHNE